jgi:hypothetical protein
MITRGVYQLIRYRASDLPAEAGSHESQNNSYESQTLSRGFRLQAEVRSAPGQ